MSRSRRALFGCLLACALGAGAAPAGAATPLPPGWPAHLLLGMRDEENGAADLRASTPLEARYHYLSGGVNTGQGWTTWAEGDGSFVTRFIADSQASGFLPVFSLYQLRPSLPGASNPDEAAGDLANLAMPATMRTYFEQLRLFFQRAGAAGGPVVLHVEPDLWGYAERAAGSEADASAVPAQVAATGLPELGGLPNTVAGLARAFVRLRDTYATNVQLAYHLSVWGTGVDIARSDPSDATVDDLAGQAARWYRSLGARFDLLFAEFADRDAAYADADGKDPEAWWDEGDYARNARFLAGLSTSLNRRAVVWQVPLGNKVMRAVDNTPDHYQDDRVQWLLGTGYRAHLRAYTAAGVIGFLFGKAQPTGTCACDDAHDGITDPAPIGGNRLASLSADDDGGYFRHQVAAYYAAGPPAVPSVVSAPRRAKVRRKAPRVRIAATVSRPGVGRGHAIGITVRVTSAGPASTLVAVQLYPPGARNPIFQQPFHDERLRARVPHRLRVRYTVPRGARRGHWTVKVGVFDPDWKRLYRWSERAATFTVR